MEATQIGSSRTLFFFLCLLRQRYIQQQAEANADVVAATTEILKALAVVTTAIDKAVEELQQAREILASASAVVALAEDLMVKRKHQQPWSSSIGNFFDERNEE